MHCFIRSPRFYLVRLAMIVVLVLCLGTRPAIASVHEYPAPNGGQLLRSLQTLRDESDRAWQTVLFKQVNPIGESLVHLRLVGFPGAATFQRAKPLIITLEAVNAQPVADVSPEYLTDNAAEYDIQPVLATLSGPVPLRLTLPLDRGQFDLVIPPFVVREWQQVVSWQP